LAGVMREYATIHLMETDSSCKSKQKEEEKRKCAEKEIKKYFGDEDRQGILRFYDAQILLFPVSSIQGTVWITTKELLEYWFGEVKNQNVDKLLIQEDIKDRAYAIKGIDIDKPLNLGWLLLEVNSITDNKEVVLPDNLTNFVKRIVLVSDRLFSQIVNDNLEVRTSVKIDPETGTAEAGKLFTYEAIPRGTVLGFEISFDKRREKADSIEQLIESTFSYLKLLGIGGLGTRGFGRIEVFNDASEGGDNNEKS